MVNHPLRIQAIQKFIASQEKIIQDYKIEITALTSRIEELEIGVELFNKSLEPSRKELEGLEAIFGATSLSVTPNLQSSPEQTFKFLQAIQDPMGSQIRDLIEDYRKIGVTMHPRNIIEHLNQLVSENKIYQTNPEIQRGRRYKVVEPLVA